MQHTILNTSFIGTEGELHQFKNLLPMPFEILFNDTNPTFSLRYINEKLTLTHQLQNLSLCVDFGSPEIQKRIDPKAAKLGLIKAIEGKSKEQLTIIDATAGLGTDSFCIAARGHTVAAIEQSPIVYALLKDGLIRVQDNTNLTEIANNITLHLGDAQTAISSLPQHDIIYLDPMFPEKQKSAKVKKGMQVLQDILGHSDLNEVLFEEAIKNAKKKIVVKRPKQSPYLGSQHPSSQVIGKTNRFDVYAL